MTPPADFFICHATEDKPRFARPLAEMLRSYGAKVWYDEFTVTVGDSLSRKIDEGLATARYGVVVLSKTFFTKKWTEYELRGLTTRDVEVGKVILPVWLSVDKPDVMGFSPSLADKAAIVTDGSDIESVALRLLEVARPELFKAVHTRSVLLDLIQTATKRTVPTRGLKIAPRRHAQLPGSMLNRIRLVRGALFECHPHSMEHWVDAFARDVDPELEVRFWEHIAAAYLEYVHLRDIGPSLRVDAFTAVFGICAGLSGEKVANALSRLPSGAEAEITQIARSVTPPFDINDPLMGE